MSYFVDQRYPDERISSSQLWKEYWEQVGRGEINPEEVTFPQYIFNCMESEGGTLSFVSEKEDSVKTSSTTTNKAPPKERYSKQARKGRLKL